MAEVQGNGTPRATVVAVPRDHFSMAVESLDSILSNTDVPFELVYVDGNSPRGVRSQIERRAHESGFTLLRSDRYLTPNEARNIGMREVRTEFVAFVDNDVIVDPGWLGALIDCADETGATLVGPLTCEYDPDTIHFAGGSVEIEEEAEEDARAVRHVRERMHFPQRKINDVKGKLRREECELCEFHTVMARTSIFDEIGPFDEEMLNTREHLDFSLAVAKAGGTIWFEPRSKVVYLPPTPLKPSDLHFFCLRWSDEWEERSLERFREKWGLANDEFFQRRVARLGWRRQNAVVPPIVRRVTLGRGSHRLLQRAKPVERRVNRILTARHRRHEEAPAEAERVAAGS